ncbi:DUF2167 domain-containing protein [Paenibacillus mendelii]|uniref:DUF2167 domain-containing protein n=1 Tax=Paenibacillus mendelii TaxID=206163 RepID=A0ABV6JBI6_9BACL|nr:DUF2167 domain-containing protein [Paenibacillus mendelii]MCQ6558609.1 DUF2167 domain-containing protein [Paenibacillus mendelii]
MKKKLRHTTLLYMMLMAILVTLSPNAVHAETGAVAGNAPVPELNWVMGSGQTVDLGDNLAQLKLDESLVFLNGADTETFLINAGGKPTGKEIGAVFPTAEDQQWVLYFDYDETGYIDEEEKDEIDAEALLQSYKDGTEEANKDLAEQNRIYVDSWDVAPFYDENLHSLAWSLLAHDASDNKLINYNVRLLTRQGVISAVLVSDPEHLAADRKVMEQLVLSSFSLKEGSRYEDYDAGTDKKAEYGLTGLILGGAGLVVAKKVGLIATILLFAKKFWIIFIAGGAAIWNFLRGRSKRQAAKQDQDDKEEAGREAELEANQAVHTTVQENKVPKEM